MQILPASREDLLTVVSWITSEQNCRLWAGPMVSFPVELDVLMEEIEFSVSNSVIAVMSDDIVVFAQIIKKSPDRNHIARFIIDPAKRGQGLGLEFFEALLSLAFASVTTASLNVYRFNQPAVNLYRKFGFHEDKTASTQDTIFMMKHQ